jgi:hypothetical protein
VKFIEFPWVANTDAHAFTLFQRSMENGVEGAADSFAVNRFAKRRGLFSALKATDRANSLKNGDWKNDAAEKQKARSKDRAFHRISGGGA